MSCKRNHDASPCEGKGKDKTKTVPERVQTLRRLDDDHDGKLRKS